MNERSATPSTQERLLVAGAELFADRGLQGASVRAICKRAGTSMNMIHHYFGSKQGLFDAIVRDFSAAVFDVPMQLLELPARSPEDLRARMEMFLETTLDAYLRHRVVLQVLVREQAEVKAAVALLQRLGEFLNEAKERGLVREKLDTEMIVGAMLDRVLNQALFAPWILANYGTDPKEDRAYRARWCQANLDLFLHGFAAAPDAG